LVFKSAFNKELDFDSDTIKCSLHTSSHTPNQDSHQYWNVSVDNEVSGTGYTAGGVTLSSPTVSYDSASNTVKFDAADASFTGNATTNARWAIIYDSTPTNKPLIAYIDLVDDSQVLSITWHVNGIASVTVA
jgi:Tfp pilus assembly protein PilV